MIHFVSRCFPQHCYWRVIVVAFAILSVLVRVGRAATLPVDVQNEISNRVTYGYSPGIALALINSSSTNYYAFGRASYSDSRALNEDSLFEIGSLTKSFTATLLADMSLRSELQLTNNLKLFFPAVVKIPSRNQKEITLLHLATHTSGLPRLPDNFTPKDWMNPYADYTDFLRDQFLSTYTLPVDPGARYTYSNFGFALLGDALVNELGTNFEALVRARITSVLGMPDTSTSLGAAQQSRLTQGHSGVLPVPYWDFPTFFGAGGLKMSVRDMATFIAANMGIRTSPLSAAFTECQKTRANSDITGGTVGLAWQILNNTGVKIIWHDGATGGFNTFVGFNGTTGVVIFSNGNLDVSDLGFSLLSPALGFVPVPVPASMTSTNLRRYAGLYKSDFGDSFRVQFLNDHLISTYSGDFGLSFTLYPSSLDNFFSYLTGGFANFSRSSDGRSTSLKWTQAGVISGPYNRVHIDPILRISRADGKAAVEIQGEGDRLYEISASTDLKHWIPTVTNTIWDFPYSESVNSTNQNRFFRAAER